MLYSNKFQTQIIQINKVIGIYMWLLSEKVETLENDIHSFLKQIITKDYKIYIYIYIYIYITFIYINDK